MKKLINNVRKGKSLVALIFLLTIAPLCILYAVNVPIGEENDDGSYDSYEQTTAPTITIADNPKAKAIIDSTNGHLVLFPVKDLGEGEFTVTVKFGIPTQFHEDNHDLLSAEFVDAVGLTFEGNPSIKEVNGEKVLEAIVKVAEGASKGGLAMTFDGEKDETHPDCNVLLLPVEFITPAGDPVAQPKDAGDGQNEFTFNSAKPGVLEINLKVKVPGIGGMPADIQNKFFFEIDAIGNSKMQWDAANGGGKPTFNGDFMTAKVKFTGLPQNNSDFGKKMARIKFDGNKVGEEDFEVFFPRNAKNHPGAGSGVTPNWFYYWSQVSPVLHPLKYGGSSGTQATAEVEGMHDWSYGGGGPNKTEITVYDEVVTAGKSYGVGEKRSGIDYFLAVLHHEGMHVEQISKADTLVTSTGQDCFRYGWSWNSVGNGTNGFVHNHWAPGPDGAWGVKGVDDDNSGIVDDAFYLPAGLVPMEAGLGDDEKLEHDMFGDWPKSWMLPAPNDTWHPIESEAVNKADQNHDEGDGARDDWGSPGKNSKTEDKYDD